jgi:hypothetical protein
LGFKPRHPVRRLFMPFLAAFSVRAFDLFVVVLIFTALS